MARDLEELQQHLATVADLAAADPVYLPIFARLERMIADEESRSDTLARARAMAGRRR